MTAKVSFSYELKKILLVHYAFVDGSWYLNVLLQINFCHPGLLSVV